MNRPSFFAHFFQRMLAKKVFREFFEILEKGLTPCTWWGGDLNFPKGPCRCIVCASYRSPPKEPPVEFFDTHLFFAGSSTRDVAVASSHRGGYFVVAPGVD